MMGAVDAIRAALARVDRADAMDRIDLLKAMLAVRDVDPGPSPAHGMEVLRRGGREQELLRLLAEQERTGS